MWIYTYSKEVTNLDSEKIWSVWTDVNDWINWQDDIEAVNLASPFKAGSFISFKPKGGPSMNLEITEVTPLHSFTDLTKFPLAKMYDKHEIIKTSNGYEIKTTLTLSGPLAFLWNKLVVKGIADGLEEQTNNLIKRIHEKTRD
jgi:hypothetical protein